jgi:hypothetical protein
MVARMSMWHMLILMISKQARTKGPSFNPFGVNVAAFTSEDLMNNLPKAMSNIGKAMGGGVFPTDSPTFKISIRDYEDM